MKFEKVWGEFKRGGLTMISKGVGKEILNFNFQEIHSQVTEARKDSLMMENIRADLNSMQIEKEQLSKRTDRIERKLRGVTNIKRLLQHAEKCRLENERLDKIGHVMLEQRNLVISFSNSIEISSTTISGSNTNN